MTAEWTEERLHALIQRVPESGVLEFKAAESLGSQNNRIAELTKDISAFANASGGTIIFGIAEDRETHMAKSIDPVDENEWNRERMDQLLDRIRPRISDVRISVIPISGSARPGVVYVLDVPQSTTAHQATDYRYYKRRNFKSDPMEDYEVRDVMNRQTRPQVRTILDFDLQAGRFIWILENVGEMMIRHFCSVVDVPTNNGQKWFYLTPSVESPRPAFIDHDDGTASWRWVLMNSVQQPLFPRAAVSMSISLSLSDKAPAQNVTTTTLAGVRYSTYADDMSPESATLDLGIRSQWPVRSLRIVQRLR